MALKFKPGDAVQQVMPAPMVGTVVKAEIVGGDIQFLVANEDGSIVRYFKEDEIEAAGEPTP